MLSSSKPAATDDAQIAPMFDLDASPDLSVQDYRVDFTRLLYMLYIDLEGQITRADSKAQIILSINAILGAIMANFGFGLPTNALNSITTLEAVIVICYVLLGGSLVLSVYFAIMAAYPRLRDKAATPPPVSDPRFNLYYSVHITSVDVDAYVERFMGASVEDVKANVMKQIHGKSGVVQRKFYFIQRSMVFVMIEIMLWVIARTLILFA